MDSIICRPLSVPTLSRPVVLFRPVHSLPILTIRRPPQPIVPLLILTTRRPPQPIVPLSISPLLSANQTMRKRHMKIFSALSPGNMEENYWISEVNDLLLADMVTKQRKFISSILANVNVDATISNLGTEVAEKDPLWAELVAESKVYMKLRSEYEDSVQTYILMRKPMGMSQEDFKEILNSFLMALHGYGRQYTKIVAYWLLKYGLSLRPPQPAVPLSISPLLSANQTMRKRDMKIVSALSPDDRGSMEENYWISEVNDLLLADLVTKERRFNSAFLAMLNVEATIRNLGAEVAEKDPLWAELVAESKLYMKLRSEYDDSVDTYILMRKPMGMSQEDFKKILNRFLMALNGYGRQYTKIVAYWSHKYRLSLL